MIVPALREKPARYLSRTVDLDRSTGRRLRVKLIIAFLKDDTAATAIEYGLIAAGIALAIIAVVNGLGAKLNTRFSSINSSLK